MKWSIRGGKRRRSQDLDWRFINADETTQHAGLVRDLMDKRIDGMQISGVFTQDEIDRALHELTNPDYLAMRTPFSFGSMLGAPLNNLGADATDRSPHSEDAERCRPIYNKAFGFDPHERVAGVLEPMLDGLPVAAASENGRDYNAGNVRWYEPGMGGLRAHNGNEFVDLVGDGAMAHLLTTTHVIDHMSYFVVLQPPEQGGELAAYKRLWNERLDEAPSWADANRDDSSFDAEDMLQLTPGAGDMILFGGGWRWHRVEKVEGAIPRITYGGFASASKDGTALHLWC